MKREYSGTVKNDATFFVGKEVEKTIAYGKRTLFVVGIQNVQKIERIFKEELCGHIFFGANHSLLLPTVNWEIWETMIAHFLKKDIPVSLDIPYIGSELILDSNLVTYPNFIPQIRVPIPNINEWPKNTMVKVDDIGYDQTNPGVWWHTIDDLKDNKKFTSWDKYTKDKEITDE